MKQNTVKKRNPIIAKFLLLAQMFKLSGNDNETSNRRARHLTFMGGGNGEFHPAKHPKMNYAQQNRIARKRRRARA